MDRWKGRGGEGRGGSGWGIMEFGAGEWVVMDGSGWEWMEVEAAVRGYATYGKGVFIPWLVGFGACSIEGVGIGDELTVKDCGGLWRGEHG